VGSFQTLIRQPRVRRRRGRLSPAYQRTIGAYRDPDRVTGKQDLVILIDSLRAGVPAEIFELSKLGRTMNRRANDILAYSRTNPASATAPPRRSMVNSNTYADQLWAFTTSSTTSPSASSIPAASGHSYGPKCEEPVKGRPAT